MEIPINPKNNIIYTSKKLLRSAKLPTTQSTAKDGINIERGVSKTFTRTRRDSIAIKKLKIFAQKKENITP